MNNIEEGVKNNKNLINEDEQRQKASSKGITKKQLKELVKGATCTETQKEELVALLLRNREQFVTTLTPEYEGGNSFFISHEIRLSTSTPIWTKQFRLTHKEELLMDERAKKQFEGGVIEEVTTSEYNSPAMCVPKKDNTWRPVIDFRNINQYTIKENWPIPRTEEALDALSKAKYMTVIDCTSGYWQIPLSERSKSYTAFSTKSGRWQYKVVPMGITNAAPTFQKNMELMLVGMLRKFYIVYIDNIIVYSNLFEEHVKHLESVFGRLKQCNMVIKPEKLSLCKSEIQYLGHIVRNGIVKPTDNENKIKEKTLPQTMEEVRSFTMCANSYRRFIPKFAILLSH